MKNLKLLSALLVLVCSGPVVAGEISKSSAFATWADEKEAPVPQRKLASYDTIDKACRNLAATIQIRADLVNKPQYWCRGGIDGLVDAYARKNHKRIDELEKEPLSQHFEDTPYMANRGKGVEKRGMHSQQEFYHLRHCGSSVYNKLYASRFTDEATAKELLALIADSID